MRLNTYFIHRELTILRNRGSAIIIENQKVVLIKRNRNKCVYYVFPGGGIKEGETPNKQPKEKHLKN